MVLESSSYSLCTYKNSSRDPLQTTIVPSFDPFREQVQPLGHSCDKTVLNKIASVPTEYTILSIMFSWQLLTTHFSVNSVHIFEQWS